MAPLRRGLPNRTEVLTLVGVVILFGAIALPWYTFQLTPSSGGLLTLFGWQYRAIAVLLAIGAVPTIVTLVTPRLTSARMVCAVILLALAVAALVLSWTELGSVWQANCHVECLGPFSPAPGPGLVLLVFGPVLVVGANLRRKTSVSTTANTINP